ncbi:MAG: aldehyde dehydrogenase family protein [Planctomycetes bacterium]|nr:aldehyde dehydrogenase family protein [Planctomycetota bacterium]
MLKESYPYYLAGRPIAANRDLVVTNKFTGQPATRVALAGAEVVRQAVDAASAAFESCRRLKSFQRQRVLAHVAGRIEQRAGELATALAIEAGKPIRDARGEVTRLLDTFRIAAEESVRIGGEVLPLDISARTAAYESFWRRFPIGPCAFITPFNFPLNLVAHKVAPAIAAGCPFVLKPASRTPIGALIVAELLAETEWPKDAFSVLPCVPDDFDPAIRDERIKLLSFTGSPAVGWALKARAGRKKIALELGGNAACIVDRGVDLEYAADRITIGAFYQSGQSCISVQRVLAHRDIYDALRTRLVERAEKLKAGDPLQEDTFLGPLIDEMEARRVETWVADAVAAGARVLCGGRRDGALYAATYLENVDPGQKISCQEVFGPVATIEPFDDFASAVRVANESRFGLQAGVFTRDIERAFAAYHDLDVGGVVINDVPSMRVDNMPYGGVKESGLGREGVRFAIEEMTEVKLLVINHPPGG